MYTIKLQASSDPKVRARFYEFLYLCGFRKSRRKRKDWKIKLWPRVERPKAPHIPCDSVRLENGLANDFCQIVADWNKDLE